MYQKNALSSRNSFSPAIMQKACIDDKGTEFAYIDSGAPSGSTDYSTVVIVHGHTYHARKFIDFHMLYRMM